MRPLQPWPTVSKTPSRHSLNFAVGSFMLALSHRLNVQALGTALVGQLETLFFRQPWSTEPSADLSKISKPVMLEQLKAATGANTQAFRAAAPVPSCRYRARVRLVRLGKTLLLQVVRLVDSMHCSRAEVGDSLTSRALPRQGSDAFWQDVMLPASLQAAKNRCTSG